MSSREAEHWRDHVVLAIVLGGAVAVAVAVNPRDSYDTFRLPKALVFRAEATLLVAVYLLAALLGAPFPRPRWRAHWSWLPLAALAAMCALTVVSSKPLLSLSALGTGAATLVIFFATVAAGTRNRGWTFLWMPLAAAVANAIMVLLQEANLWMPFGVRSGIPHHLQCNALIGNPNEVGAYLGAAALAAIAALRWERRVQWSALAALVLVAGLLASQTVTAVASLGAALLVLCARSSPKQTFRTVAAAAVAIVLIVLAVPPFRTRAANMIQWAKEGDYNMLVSDRLTPFTTAAMMGRDHPLTGLGPGTFAWHYYDYKLRAEERYPILRRAYSRGVNYGEVHNDHLQLLAEGGIVAFALFLAMLAALAAISFSRADATSAQQRFAIRLALPLAVYWAVLSLAQFPLETTVVRALLIHLAALCVAWRSA